MSFIAQKYIHQLRGYLLRFCAYRGRAAKAALVVFSVLIVLGGVFYALVLRPPADFPTGRLVTIDDGMTLAEVAASLKSQHVIRSKIAFSMLVTLLAGEGGALSGEYFFSQPLSLFTVAKKVVRGEFGLVPVKITIPEGSTVKDIAALFSQKFDDFDPDEFTRLAKDKEGYLFPDTYFFLPNVKAPQVVAEMEENFFKRIQTIQKQIDEFGKPLRDVVIMASLLEKEARTLKTKRIVAGILWKRIAIGMPLQVDAVFPYINGKNTYTLTHDDLKIDSPYNTYRYKGLPAGPIANPGLDSLRAAVTPIETEYLYYLSDRKGNMYYASTFEEHKRNKRLYLN